ncbi:MAG: hypothetical protein HQ567_16410 [Candidatus Nealsonbacteria bacterium]|nr:hypothetical protein [Candidatus Nealsonbacteria bacterium]
MCESLRDRSLEVPAEFTDIVADPSAHFTTRLYRKAGIRTSLLLHSLLIAGALKLVGPGGDTQRTEEPLDLDTTVARQAETEPLPLATLAPNSQSPSENARTEQIIETLIAEMGLDEQQQKDLEELKPDYRGLSLEELMEVAETFPKAHVDEIAAKLRREHGIEGSPQRPVKYSIVEKEGKEYLQVFVLADGEYVFSYEKPVEEMTSDEKRLLRYQSLADKSPLFRSLYDTALGIADKKDSTPSKFNPPTSSREVLERQRRLGTN